MSGIQGGRGQLDMEIARRDWRIVRADARTIFDRYPASIWQKLSHRPPPSIVLNCSPLASAWVFP
jgi:putative AlgH/UPF0301 family transcriptional regulator